MATEGTSMSQIAASMSQIALKSAGPQGSSDLHESVRAGAGFVAVRWSGSTFMLSTPVPADDVEDIVAARAALAEPGERVPYDQLRRELGF